MQKSTCVLYSIAAASVQKRHLLCPDMFAPNLRRNCKMQSIYIVRRKLVTFCLKMSRMTIRTQNLNHIRSTKLDIIQMEMD